MAQATTAGAAAVAFEDFFEYFFGEQPDAGPQRREGLGSGVIVSEQGYILTNQHVVESVDQIEIALADSRKLQARVVGTDPETDLAVLKVEGRNLPAITFANADHLRVGDIVLAIGNPFGIGQTVTLGIVSGLGRSHLGITVFENFIQTDAAINFGNSGGALVDGTGKLVGLNSAIYGHQAGIEGIGFAIPVDLVRGVVDAILKDGRVVRGWIGVVPRDLTAAEIGQFGIPELPKSNNLILMTSILVIIFKLWR